MKHNRSLLALISLLLAASMVLGACTPSATPTAAPAEPTTAPEQPTTAPAAEQPTAAPAAEQPTEAPTAVPAEAGPVSGGTFTYAETGGYYTLDPYVTPWHSTPQYSVFDTMLALKPDLTSYVGMLVDDNWEVAADNLSVTFHVRPGIKFTDGTPVDANALKWDLDHFLDPAVGSPSGGWMQGIIKEFQAPDANTLKVVLETPYAPLFFQLSSLEIVSPTAYQSLGPDKFALAPVGSGPWIVKEIVPDNSITFTRNPDYAWSPVFYQNRGAMYPETFVIKYMSDSATIYAAVETGELTIAGIPSQFLDQAKANPNLTIVNGQENGAIYLGFNTQMKPFDDPKLRNAIAMGINRDELIQAGYNGQAVPVYTALAQSEMGYDTAIDEAAKANSSDPEKAMQMLDEAGYTVGADGTRVGPDGKALELTLTIRTEEEYKPVAEALQAQFADMGIKVNLEVKEAQVIKQMTIDGTYQMILWNYGLLDPSILTYLFHSKNIGASNRTRYNNPDLDKLLDQADGALDWTARKGYVSQVLQLLVDQHPNVPLYSRLTSAAYRNDQIKGIFSDPLGGLYWNDAWMINQ